MTAGYTIPLVDLDRDEQRTVVIDRERGLYLTRWPHRGPTSC